MLHTKNALSRAGCLLPLYSSSASATLKLCGSSRVSTPASQYSSEARSLKDILPTSSPLIDEPVDKIHNQMTKLVSTTKEKKIKGMQRFSARLEAEDLAENPQKINSSLVCAHFKSVIYYNLNECIYIY